MYVNGASKHLKAVSGWNNGSGNGTDDFGFSAFLPGGRGIPSGSFSNVGYWQSATEYNASLAYIWDMYYNYEGVYYYDGDKGFLHSVRCVQD